MPPGLVGEYAYRPVMSSRGCSDSPWGISPLFSPPRFAHAKISDQIGGANNLLSAPCCRPEHRSTAGGGEGSAVVLRRHPESHLRPSGPVPLLTHRGTPLPRFFTHRGTPMSRLRPKSSALKRALSRSLFCAHAFGSATTGLLRSHGQFRPLGQSLHAFAGTALARAHHLYALQQLLRSAGLLGQQRVCTVHLPGHLLWVP
jgi:hypothetical protein